MISTFDTFDTFSHSNILIHFHKLPRSLLITLLDNFAMGKRLIYAGDDGA